MKKLLIVSMILLSQTTFAKATSTAHVYPISFVHNDTDRTAESKHTYSITNDAATSQYYQVCYDLTTCPDWPSQTRTTHVCEDVTLNPKETKSAEKHVFLNFRYHFTTQAWCHVVAQTQVIGGDYSLSRDDQQQFQVGN